MAILQLSLFPLVMGSLPSLLRLGRPWLVGVVASWPCRGGLPARPSVLSPSVKVAVALMGPHTREGKDPRTG